VFTSSGTEANQLAVRSVLESQFKAGKAIHWVTTAVEHDSNRQLIQWVRSLGGQVTELAVDSAGQLSETGLEERLSSGVSLISCIWVNNETGVITDLSLLSSLADRFGIPLHVDAAQAWGKLPLNLIDLQAQYVTFSGHKIGGLAGTGVLWTGRVPPMDPVIFGKQEKGRRGGTENLLGIIALGAAALEVEPISWAERVRPLRDRLEIEVCQRIPKTVVNGGSSSRVANTLNLNFEGVECDGLVMALDLAGFAVSAGSACSSGVLGSSHVLKAMGKTESQAMAAIRISLVDSMPWSELEAFVNAVDRAVQRMRNSAGFVLV
jgi:cysteine desulfurase